MGNQDIRWSEEHVVAGKKFCNKIWNASRFVLMAQNGKFEMRNSKLTSADKKIIGNLKKVTTEVDGLIEKYEFGKALHKLYEFFWHQYADIYIEAAKRQLADKKSKIQTQKTLLKIHTDLLKLLHPFMPFITEEIWAQFSKDLLIIEKWPE